ncbi:unnamed protein product, partial [Dovyalis caffra]
MFGKLSAPTKNHDDGWSCKFDWLMGLERKAFVWKAYKYKPIVDSIRPKREQP